MRDGKLRVTGQIKFTQDHAVAGMLHCRLVRSPYPHARIKAVGVDVARTSPGVVAVLTGQDVLAQPGTNAYFGQHRVDQPILAIDRARYAGDPVAMVVAETAEAAGEAAIAVDVDYEELPYVDDPLAAMADGAPVIHDQWPDNDCGSWKLRRGDVEQGWRESDRIFEDVYYSPSASPLPLEPHVVIAAWDAGKLDVWTSAQAPYTVHRVLQATFELGPEDVRVRTFDLGGGYGAKTGVKVEPIAAFAAKAVGRPVRLELSREEVFLTVSKHATRVHIKTGVRDDGRLVARRVDILWDAGAYSVATPFASGQGMLRALGPYDIPHSWVDSRARYTNTVPTGPFRGAMTSQLCWAYESQMDDIAADLGIDPVELRFLNLLVDGSTFATGERLHDLHFAEILSDVRDALAWGTPSQPSPPGRARGKGVALMMKSTQAPTRSEARLIIGRDGRIALLSSSVEMGQGARDTMTQLAAEALDVPAERIERPLPDTAVTPYDTTTGSSRTTFSMGAAVAAAAAELRRKLEDLASARWEVDPRDIRHEGGALGVPGDPSMSRTYEQVVADAGLEELSADGMFETTGGVRSLDPDTGQGENSTVHWHQAGVGVEVEVDLDTGAVEVLRCHASTYAGRMVDPLRVRQQLEGGAIFGLGPAMFEELRYEDGHLTNPNMAEYLIPSVRDLPAVLTSAGLESADPGAELHGVGEMSTPAVAPAIGNAIRHATGARIKTLPMSRERLLKSLTDGRS